MWGLWVKHTAHYNAYRVYSWTHIHLRGRHGGLGGFVLLLEDVESELVLPVVLAEAGRGHGRRGGRGGGGRGLLAVPPLLHLLTNQR